MWQFFIELQALGNCGGACYIPPTHLAIPPMTPTKCLYLIMLPLPNTNNKFIIKKTKTCHPNHDSLHLQLMHTWTLKLVVINLVQQTGMLICKCKLVHNLTKLNVLCWLSAHGIYHTIDLHMKRGHTGGGWGLCYSSGKDSPSHTFLHFCVFLLAHSSPFTLPL
jgi:hypothetical protein